MSERAKQRPKEFDNKEFKKLILNFILSNNLSFRIVFSKSFIYLLKYLKE